MRRRLRGALPLAAALLVASACAEPAPETAVVAAEDTTPQTPEGYAFRLDSERSDPGEFLLRPGRAGRADLHVTTGPAGIAWRAEDAVSRDRFAVRASFLQRGAPVGYREAYGIFVGGRDLDGPDQEYTYMLVRGTGDFLVKRRRGETTETLVDWTPHPAVVRVAAEGDEPRNELAVEAGAEETRFLVNGTVVHTMPTPRARPHGIPGIRVNHRLDVELEDWTVEPWPDAAEDEPTES